MDIAQIGTGLAALIAAITIVGVVYVGVKVKANESALNAQREFIAVQEKDIADLRGKLAEALVELATSKRENATLVSAVTQRAEVKALHDAEDAHHVEQVELLTRMTEILLRIEEALNRG